MGALAQAGYNPSLEEAPASSMGDVQLGQRDDAITSFSSDEVFKITLVQSANKVFTFLVANIVQTSLSNNKFHKLLQARKGS